MLDIKIWKPWKYQELIDYNGDGKAAIELLNELEEEHVDVEVVGYKVVVYPGVNKERTFILVRYRDWEGDESA